MDKRKAGSQLMVDSIQYKHDEHYIHYLADVVESSDDAIFSKSLDGIIKSWNRGGEKMFGYTAAQAIGQHISLIIPAEYINEEEDIDEKICNGQLIDHYETVRLKKNGSQIFVSLTVSLLKDRHGAITGIAKIARDISARKRSEEKLQESLTETSAYKYALDESSIVVVTDHNGIILHVNNNFCNISKYTPEEVIGQDYRIINSGHHPKEFIHLLWTTIHRGEIWKGELKNKAKDGSFYWVYSTIIPFLYNQGRPCQFIAIQTDVTLRKLAEEDLIITNLELAIQNTEKEKRAEELAIANKELGFQNSEKEKRAEELLIANKELAFQNSEKEKRAEELAIANKELGFQNSEKEKLAGELLIANKELAFQNTEKEKRAEELVTANMDLVFQNDEKEKWALEVINMNRHLKISGEQIKEVNKELESFSYSVSHDLRAPLRAVHGYAKMLKENYEPQLDEEANRLMNNILNNAKKMGQLIDDLLNFSRTGRKELVQTKVNMERVVTNLCTELKKERCDSNIEFLISELPPALADIVTIKHVWQNLISNAIKYSGLKDKAIIEIGFEIKDDEIIYYIKDNGAGFDMRYADKLFGVFQRLHSDEEFEGTGVGLALVQRIILKHGGRVWAESKVDQGAIFFFTLKAIRL